MRPHQQRYVIEVVPAVVLIAAWIALSPLLPTGVPRVAVVLLPLIAVAWMLAAMLRRLLLKDELEQRIELIAIAIASAGVGLGSFAWALLESVDVVARGSLFYVLPGLVAVYGAVKLWALRRYR